MTVHSSATYEETIALQWVKFILALAENIAIGVDVSVILATADASTPDTSRDQDCFKSNHSICESDTVTQVVFPSRNPARIRKPLFDRSTVPEEYRTESWSSKPKMTSGNVIFIGRQYSTFVDQKSKIEKAKNDLETVD